jgi:hypothetical protein
LQFGILFCGGKNDDSNKKIFRIQKRVIRLIIGVKARTSHKQLLKEIKILTLVSIYIYIYILEVTYFIKKDCQPLELNSNVHEYNT